jgi:hypothetical protein
MAIAADEGPINPGVPPKTGAFLAYCKAGNKGCVDEVADISFAMLVTNATKKEWCPGEETNDVNLLTPEIFPPRVAWFDLALGLPTLLPLPFRKLSHALDAVLSRD